MTQLPDYLTILLDDTGEEFDPGVIKSEMERGMAKQRVGQSRVVVEVPVTLLFDSAADAESFYDWYFNTIKRIGFFTWTDPGHRRFAPGASKMAPLASWCPLLLDMPRARGPVCWSTCDERLSHAQPARYR
jgi:hypothetical protein